MGNRSNINFITEHRDNGEVVGLNVYLHWGGVAAQLLALAAADGIAYERRENDYGWFIHWVVDAAFGAPDGRCGARFTPFVVPDVTAAYGYVTDNQHAVLAFDLPRQSVALAEGYPTMSPSVIATFPLDHAGIAQALDALVPQCDPQTHCPTCVARVDLQAAGMSRWEAEVAAAWARHDEMLRAMACDRPARRRARRPPTKHY